MRLRAPALLAVALWPLVLGSPASGVPLGDATLTIALGVDGDLGLARGVPAVRFTGSIVGSAFAPGSVTIMAGSGFAGAAGAVPTNPATVTNLLFTVFGNRSGTFLGSGPGGTAPGGAPGANLRGSMLVSGGIRWKGLGGHTLLSMPLSIGAPGFATATGYSFTLFSFTHDSWTAGTAKVTGLMTPATVTATGEPLTSVATGNVFTLVSPIRIYTPAALAPVIAGFARLTVGVVPEPGTLALFGTGAAVLILCGRRRPSVRSPPTRG